MTVENSNPNDAAANPKSSTPPEAAQQELANFAKRFFGEPLETDTQRLIKALEKANDALAAIANSALNAPQSAAPDAFADVDAGITGAPKPERSKPADDRVDARLSRLEKFIESLPAAANGKPATTPADPRKAATAPADPAADYVARERPKRRRF